MKREDKKLTKFKEKTQKILRKDLEWKGSIRLY